MKKLNTILIALALLLTLGQCKKHDIIENNWVHITVKVNNGGKHIVYPGTGAYTFTTGDTIYVGNNRKYVGCLGYKDGAFSGGIDPTSCDEEDYLHFYFMGGKGPLTNTLTAGETTSFTADISDQSTNLPIITYGHSTQKYTSGSTSYTCFLFNECALVKFNTNVASSTVTLSGMFTQAKADFEADTIAPTETTGNITFNTDAEGVGWAILLPHDGEITATASTTAAGYNPETVTVPTINNNDYLNEGIAVNLFNPLASPLTFEAMEAGASVTFTKAPTIAELPIEYSLNGGTWTTYSTPIPLTNIGDKVSFRGDNARYATGASSNNYSYFSFDKDCSVYGNIMSLVDKESFATNTTLTQWFTFCHLFGNFDSSTNQNAPNPHLYNHSSKTLVLPATTLTRGCYFDMFNGCTNLTTAPVLPATTLAQSCYEGMFSGCTSLAATPTLSATTLAQSCYNSMFSGCTSLTTAPELAVTDLTNKYSCYRSMFSGCTSLTAAPALPATTIAIECYKNMFKGCTSLTTAPTLPATILYNYCYDGMFSGCTNLTTAPALPATTLTEFCYREMFKNCTNLTTAPTLPATTLTIFCYYEMFNGCSNLNSVTCLATNISATQCTLNWLSGVASSGTFTKAPSMTSWTTGASGIPSGWTVVERDPELTFEAMTAGAKVTFTKGSSVTWTNPVEYSLNGGAWTTYTSGTAITLANVGDKVMFRGNNATYNGSNFACTNECYIYGNIMSLIDATGYATTTTMTSSNNGAFKSLFANNTNIKNHASKNLVLPATTLAAQCYMGMFNGCTGLTTAPALPATTLAPSCYFGMFSGCTGLTTAPELPATNLDEYCYTMMFFNCTSLTAAPALPATTMTTSCYQDMFAGTGLTAAPELSAMTLAFNCYSGMFVACTSLTTAPTLPATTLAEGCYENMFSSCTSLTSAPELPALVLAPDCYNTMFEDCINLNSVTCLATDISASNCTYNWLFGVAATGTFTKASTMSSWPTGPDGSGNVNGIPEGWTVQDQ